MLGQSVDDLIRMAHHAISSHVLDAFLISPKVAAKWKRKLLLALDGRYLDLVNDKFGSRVGDTIWDRAADGFMKVSQMESGRRDSSALVDLNVNDIALRKKLPSLCYLTPSL